MNFFCSFDRFAWLCKALPLTHISQLTKSKRILWARCVTQKKTQTLNNHLHNLRIQTNLCVEYEALPSRIKQQCRAHNHLNEWMHSAKVALHLQRGQFSNEISGTEIGWCTIALLQYYFVSIRIVFFGFLFDSILFVPEMNAKISALRSQPNFQPVKRNFRNIRMTGLMRYLWNILHLGYQFVAILIWIFPYFFEIRIRHQTAIMSFSLLITSKLSIYLIFTLQPSHVNAPKWKPAAGSPHTLHVWFMLLSK